MTRRVTSAFWIIAGAIGGLTFGVFLLGAWAAYAVAESRFPLATARLVSVMTTLSFVMTLETRNGRIRVGTENLAYLLVLLVMGALWHERGSL